MFVKINRVVTCISRLCFAVYYFLKIFTYKCRPRFTGRRKKNTLHTINTVNVIFATVVKIFVLSIILLFNMVNLPSEC